MLNLIANIGLDINGTRSLQADVVLQILAANGFTYGKHAVHQSDSEATLVVELVGIPFGPAPGAALHQTSVDLQQDCVAVYSPKTQRGALLGPKPWGKFNPEYFLQLDGSRLAQKVAA